MRKVFECPYCRARYRDSVVAGMCAATHVGPQRWDATRRIGWATVAWGVAWLGLSLGLGTGLAVLCLPAWVGHVYLIVRRARRERAWLRRWEEGPW